MGLFRNSSTSPRNEKRTSPTREEERMDETNHTHGVGHNHHGGSLHRKGFLGSGEDPSIGAARQRVMSAENAERDADRALMAARNAVAEARAHVRKLEREAAEEARLARIKQQQAAKISHRAEPLGRHDPPRGRFGFGKRTAV